MKEAGSINMLEFNLLRSPPIHHLNQPTLSTWFPRFSALLHLPFTRGHDYASIGRSFAFLHLHIIFFNFAALWHDFWMSFFGDGDIAFLFTSSTIAYSVCQAVRWAAELSRFY